MIDAMNIYLDRLRSGKIQLFNDQIDQESLLQLDADVSFCSELSVTGKAYLADDYLILNLSLLVNYLVPCKICNAAQKQTIAIRNFYYSVCLDEIKGGIFDPLTIIKETLIAEAITICECNNDNCPERGNLKQYFNYGDNNGSTKK